MEITRREAVGVAALAVGAAAIVGMNPGSAQADERSNSESADKAERQRVIAIGLTEAEADCWILTSKSAARFFDLPKLHPMDDQEVAQAIHVVQQKLLSRPAYRQYKDLLSKQTK